jgi:hypothetical protein
LFPVFSTSVIDTGGKLAAVSLTPVAISTTLAKLVAKFAALSLIPVVHLDLQISQRIFGKI